VSIDRTDLSFLRCASNGEFLLFVGDLREIVESRDGTAGQVEGTGVKLFGNNLGGRNQILVQYAEQGCVEWLLVDLELDEDVHRALHTQAAFADEAMFGIGVIGKTIRC
jgi:hypothetical protein